MKEYTMHKKALADYTAALESFKAAFDKIDNGIAKDYIRNKIFCLKLLIDDTQTKLACLTKGAQAA